ncbi:hypothetical protein GCM10009535_14130 [Streptomyces thermocarboxydovorans]|uniref:DUF3499 domain-containing protein n=1 Tax=Streptomyces thermocarboxydovorans TaxID=59298 RepID=A0ABN1HCV7_9ACTN
MESRRGPLKSAVPSNVVSPVRRCSRTACGRPAVATLTYVYADSTAVLGPLATYAEPHCYDLCAEHSERLTAPRGWEVVRLLDGSAPAQPSGDDLEALANAVREAARPQERAAGGAAADAGPTPWRSPAGATSVCSAHRTTDPHRRRRSAGPFRHDARPVRQGTTGR